ncbi:hypothetical protein XFF6960_570020 [Xanthomonas citri pv. fuscans]|nr:hypothetical protein XFF6960_570020 [Xanthomonas citri pv. fuscans]
MAAADLGAPPHPRHRPHGRGDADPARQRAAAAHRQRAAAPDRARLLPAAGGLIAARRALPHPALRAIFFPGRGNKLPRGQRLAPSALRAPSPQAGEAGRRSLL